MRKRSPTRADNEITQQFNDGLVAIFRATDTAQPGYQPVRKTERVCTLRYCERRLGMNRIYQARQQQVQLARVIRVPHAAIVPGDIAKTEDCVQYIVDTVQEAVGVFPPSTDLSLREITTKEAATNAMV